MKIWYNRCKEIENFVFPYGKLAPENDWVKLAALVPWDVAEERYAAQFINNGHPAHPARMAWGALLIQRRLNCSDRWLVKHIGENPFCGTQTAAVHPPGYGVYRCIGAKGRKIVLKTGGPPEYQDSCDSNGSSGAGIRQYKPISDIVHLE